MKSNLKRDLSVARRLEAACNALRCHALQMEKSHDRALSFSEGCLRNNSGAICAARALECVFLGVMLRPVMGERKRRGPTTLREKLFDIRIRNFCALRAWQLSDRGLQ